MNAFKNVVLKIYSSSFVFNMRLLIISFVGFLAFYFPPEMNIDFGDERDSTQWYVINDGVMGGVSTGKLFENDSSVVFKGEISFDNNGGFASFRNTFTRYDLSAYDTLEIRYRQSGQTFSFRLEFDRRYWMPTYKIILEDDSGDWQTLQAPISSLRKSRMGEFTGGGMSEALKSKVRRMGFINEGKKEGPFELEIDYIKLR